MSAREYSLSFSQNWSTSFTFLWGWVGYDRGLDQQALTMMSFSPTPAGEPAPIGLTPGLSLLKNSSFQFLKPQQGAEVSQMNQWQLILSQASLLNQPSGDFQFKQRRELLDQIIDLQSSNTNLSALLTLQLVKKALPFSVSISQRKRERMGSPTKGALLQFGGVLQAASTMSRRSQLVIFGRVFVDFEMPTSQFSLMTGSEQMTL